MTVKEGMNLIQHHLIKNEVNGREGSNYDLVLKNTVLNND
jgi:hypothetical protein